MAKSQRNRAEGEARFHRLLVQLVEEFEVLRCEKPAVTLEAELTETGLSPADAEPSAGLPRVSRDASRGRLKRCIQEAPEVEAEEPPQQKAEEAATVRAEEAPKLEFTSSASATIEESVPYAPLVPAPIFDLPDVLRKFYLCYADTSSGKLPWTQLREILQKCRGEDELDLLEVRDAGKPRSLVVAGQPRTTRDRGKSRVTGRPPRRRVEVAAKESRQDRGQARRLAAAEERQEPPRSHRAAADPSAQERDRILGTTAAKSQPRKPRQTEAGYEKIKWKKERRRRKERSRLDLRSASGRKRDLEEFLTEQSARFAQQRTRRRKAAPAVRNYDEESSESSDGDGSGVPLEQQLQQQLQQTNLMLQQMNNRLVTQEAQLLQLQASGLAARGRQSTFDTDMPGPSHPPAPRAGLVDTRQLGKPEVFKGSTEESFSDWSFIFESYLSCIDSRYIDLLEQAKFSKKSFPNRALSDVDRDLSCQLYYILVMLLRGRPLDITYNTGLGEGLESYRRIFEEFHPRVASRYVGTLTTLLSSKFGDDVEGDLAAFEKSVRRYEQESGKTLDEEMLLGIVVNGLKDSSLQSHIIRNSSRLKSFTDVKAELLEISRTNRVLQNLPQPMDLGAAPWKKGKEKGKGKDKGKGKGDKGGKGQGSDKQKPQGANPNKDRECWYCHKKGHVEAECRKKQADAKAKPKAKAKGGGKNRTPHAASPAEGEEEPEPMSASPQEPDLCFGVVAATPSTEASETEVLVDTGAGSHLFRKGFDAGALLGSRVSGPGMVTVTGEPLASDQRLRSQLETSAGTFSVEYAESEKVRFSVLSAGQAATKGTWTVIGPGVQCMVLDKHACKLRKALGETKDTMQLRKKRGVFWLPVNVVKESERVEDPDVLAATRAAKKTVPAKALAGEGEEPGEAGDSAQPGQSSSAGGPADAGSSAANPGAGNSAGAGSSTDGPGAGGPAQRLPEIGDVPMEVSEATRRPKTKKIPDTVSKAEFDEHMLTHLPMRSWCDHCMHGKVREDAHSAREPSGRASEVARISLDYCFLGRALKGPVNSVEEVKVPQDEKDGLLPILVIVDEKFGCVFSGVVAKGVNPYATGLVTEALKFCGRQKVIMMSDAEHSIRALAESAAKSWTGSVQHQTAPKGSHASNGAAERAILELARQVRTLASALENRYKKPLETEGVVFPWLVRHAGWLISRFLVKQDGRTPYERLRGRDFRGEVAECCEVVHYKLDKEKTGKLDKQTSVGVWLGKSLASDEHFLGTAQGIRRCRSIWRRPEEKRWELKHLEGMVGLPRQPRGEPTTVPSDNKAPATPGRRQPSVYITLERQIKHGKTPGCPGCECDDGNPKRHNDECRKRFEKLYPRQPVPGTPGTPVPGTPAGPMETEGGQAEMPQGTGQDLESGSTEPSQPSRPRAMEGTSEAKSGQKREVEDAGVPAPSSDSGQRRVTGKSSQGAKKQKTPEARGEKRPQDQELMGGLPTLHEKGEWEPLFAYPLDGRVEELGAYDERTGQPLPVDKVKTARGRELDKMEEHSVKKDISWEEARRQGLKIVRSRWVHGWKPLPNDPNGVRSRCVAQEINDHERDDVFSGTPPLRTHRMVLSAAATAKTGRTNRRKLIARYDVSVAFFHAVATGKIAVVPPKDLDQSKLWYLLKAMNGTREASRQWSKRVCEVMTEAGFWEVPGIPGLFYHDEWCVTLSCHGDDFIAEGESDDLDRLDALMMQSFESKILPRIGPEEFGGQTTHGDHLHRIIRWSERGFTWEADPKYSRQIVEELGLTDAKSADAPCSTECGKGRRDLEDPLDAEAAAKFRRLAGTALYLSQDRPTIQYALSEITSGMAKPTVEHELKLKHLGRYLLKYPKEVWHYEYQEQPEEAVVLTDSDWGACKRTRKSMSSYAERFGKHLIDASCAKQSVIALSSGEAEFYALVRGAAAGLLTAQIWERIGFKGLKLTLRTDSSAAKGIATRKGSGKVKHLSMKELWIQDCVQRKQLTVQKEPTKSNWADLGTKALSGSRVTELVKGMPLTRGLVMACLFASFGVATGQPKERQLETEDVSFFIYMLIIHILAIQTIWRWIKFAFVWWTTPRVSTKPAPTAGGRVDRRGLEANAGSPVYVTRKGKKFHRRHCRHLGQNPYTLQRAEATQRGFGPCTDCNP
ncbi:unnamed protein product [Symbiodinium sp. CCMP2592]|nr:unnamed protein product [Symbiodinium sp. CCMP2592]